MYIYIDAHTHTYRIQLSNHLGCTVLQQGCRSQLESPWAGQPCQKAPSTA